MIFSALLIVLGLSLFEVVSSIDNAIINAEMLSGMSEKSRKWFLSWGILLAVFVARGLLPLVILSAFTSASILYLFGGLFLVFLFCNWLLGKEKNFLLSLIKKLLGKNGGNSDKCTDNFRCW